MIRFTYNWHMYMYIHIYVSDQATLPLAWNLIKWLFLLWVFIYVCTIPVAVSYSFLLSITPSSLICTFSPPFSLCCLMLFVCTWGIILCNAFENILLKLLPPHLPGVNWLSMWEKITFPMYRSWFHDLYILHGLCCPQKPLYSLPEA